MGKEAWITKHIYFFPLFSRFHLVTKTGYLCISRSNLTGTWLYIYGVKCQAIRNTNNRAMKESGSAIPIKVLQFHNAPPDTRRLCTSGRPVIKDLRRIRDRNDYDRVAVVDLRLANLRMSDIFLGISYNSRACIRSYCAKPHLGKVIAFCNRLSSSWLDTA